jgi:hypothetical protein
MGNVSQNIPAIHPYFGLDCLPDMPHQAGFARHVNTSSAMEAMCAVAAALALTGIDAASTTTVRNRLVEANETR